MKTITRGPSINTHISLLLIAGWIALLIGGALMITPRESMRASGTAALPASTDASSDINPNLVKAASSSPTTPDNARAEWTIMVYLDADDYNLEIGALNNFIDMASVGSNSKISIVVQLDLAADDSSNVGWTDCKRFLITKGLTLGAGNELMDVGEVNMGDPNTLLAFTRWAIQTYPAQKYALILSGHGKGWQGLCWDQTSGDDNLNMNELKTALAETAAFEGKPLDLIGFDACLMDMTEVAYEIHDSASVMVASEHAEPSAGWPYSAILNNLTANPSMSAAQLANTIVYYYYESYSPTGYTMAAIDLTQIDAVARGVNALSLAMLSTNNSASIKSLAKVIESEIDGAVIAEEHGARWPDSHGLAIYFPKASADFDMIYNAHNIAFVADTSWAKFLTSYYTSSDSSSIATARAAAQQYYCKDYIDLYSFCQNLIAAQ